MGVDRYDCRVHHLCSRICEELIDTVCRQAQQVRVQRLCSVPTAEELIDHVPGFSTISLRVPYLLKVEVVLSLLNCSLGVALNES